VDFTSGHDWNRLVQKAYKRPKNARLGLAAQTEKDEVVARQHRVDDLRHDRVVEADDAREKRRARTQALDQVVPNLVLDAAPRDATAGDVGSELAKRGWAGDRGGHNCILQRAPC
jgi:hypothetical protein